MDETKVLQAYQSMAGLTEEQAKAQQALVPIAIAQVESACRPGVDSSAEPILVMLAAALVNLWASRADASASPTGSFSGNGYTIEKDAEDERQGAEVLFDNWRAEAAALLVDDGFVFLPTEEASDESEN